MYSPIREKPERDLGEVIEDTTGQSPYPGLTIFERFSGGDRLIQFDKERGRLRVVGGLHATEGVTGSIMLFADRGGKGEPPGMTLILCAAPFDELKRELDTGSRPSDNREIGSITDREPFFANTIHPSAVGTPSGEFMAWVIVQYRAEAGRRRGV